MTRQTAKQRLLEPAVTNPQSLYVPSLLHIPSPSYPLPSFSTRWPARPACLVCYGKNNVLHLTVAYASRRCRYVSFASSALWHQSFRCGHCVAVHCIAPKYAHPTASSHVRMLQDSTECHQSLTWERPSLNDPLFANKLLPASRLRCPHTFLFVSGVSPDPSPCGTNGLPSIAQRCVTGRVSQDLLLTITFFCSGYSLNPITPDCFVFTRLHCATFVVIDTGHTGRLSDLHVCDVCDCKLGVSSPVQHCVDSGSTVSIVKEDRLSSHIE